MNESEDEFDRIEEEIMDSTYFPVTTNSITYVPNRAIISRKYLALCPSTS